MRLSWKIIMITNLLMVHMCISEKKGALKVHSCCKTVTSIVTTDPIIGYELQYPDPPCVKAVILLTGRGAFCVRWTKSSVWKKICNFETKGKSICNNQTGSWAMEKFPTFLSQKKRALTRVNQITTSTPPSTSSSISNLTHVGGSAQETVTKSKAASISQDHTAAAPLFDVDENVSGKGRYGDAVKAHTCCTKVSSYMVTDPIIGYKLQNQNLPCVKAVIFKTKMGMFCLDWKAPWIREKIGPFRAQNKLSTRVVYNMTSTPPPSSISSFTHVGGSTQTTTNEYRRPTRVGVNCCKDVSRARIPSDIKLIGYKHQNALDPCVDAIIFYTEKDKYCSDPKARWVNHQLKGLKEIQD